jgi:peptidoglycan/xylan/chitin deacetylase (PgdA/CDA1 family)
MRPRRRPGTNLVKNHARGGALADPEAAPGAVSPARPVEGERFVRRRSDRGPQDSAATWDRRTLLRAAALLPLAATACAPPTTGDSAPAATSPTPGTGATGEPSGTGTAVAPRTTTELAHAGTGRAEVALTFHGAGDETLARRVLTLLHDRGAAATVLAVGTWLAQHPDAGRMVVDLGHELGNHTWSHPNLAALDGSGLRAEIERCRDRIAAATGGPGAFFRPSQAQHATPAVRRAAAAAGYPTVLSYDVDSRDFTDPGTAAIRRNVAAVTAGGVVSLHLGHPGTLDALPEVLDDLAGRGLRPVTASALFT